MGPRTVEQVGEDLPTDSTAREAPLHHLGSSLNRPRPGIRPPIEMVVPPHETEGEQALAAAVAEREARAEQRREAAQQQQEQRDHQNLLQREFMKKVAELLPLVRERRGARGDRQSERELLSLPILLHQSFRLAEMAAEETPTLFLTLLEALLEAALG